jgi:hypothetical protein
MMNGALLLSGAKLPIRYLTAANMAKSQAIHKNGINIAGMAALDNVPTHCNMCKNYKLMFCQSSGCVCQQKASKK